MVKPIASPPTCLAVPRRSTAAAKTTQTRKNVSTASTTTPLPALIPVPSAGTPSLAPSCGAVGRTHLTSSTASAAAPNCTSQYQTASSGAIRRVTRKPSVTAGLKNPPEMNPTATTMTPIGETVRERQVGRRPRVRGAAAGDEEQREGADELGDASADVVALEHGANPIPSRRTASSRGDSRERVEPGRPGVRSARRARCRRSSAPPTD